jgi:Asp-tRNA(Asn)/Glu-tRNA(Gln) amidotransferase A subunit family amidase
MPFDRRHFLAVCSTAGLAHTLLPGALFTLAVQAEAQQPGATEQPRPKITDAMLEAAATVAGITLTAEQRTMMLDGVNQQREAYPAIRRLNLPNSLAPALLFDPLPPGAVLSTERRPMRISKAPAIASAPANLEDLAFLSVRELAEYVQRKRVSSTALTEMYLTRLKRYDPMLHFVITLTEERAMAQAREADREIAAGKYRGPLHGLPWGAKDLLAVKGYPTTWGAGGFEHQTFDEDATVVKRLDAAGAVLVAKTTLGALAMGDKWFGGRTRNPWNPKQGSSGSSAGSASTVAAGCVAFAIGTETLGSISSPSTRCGVTGLRPTFGFVPRTGAMALSWSMDKLGPLCRAVEDCAIVMDTIHGPDQMDLTARASAFNWDAELDWRSLRVGYLKDAFDARPPEPPAQAPGAETELEKQKRDAAERAGAAARARRDYDRRYDQAALEKLHGMGVNLVEVKLPELPYGAMTPLLAAEAAAAFDELTLTGRDRLLTEQGPDDWPNLFRVARLYPAVEYIQANRVRTLAIQQMATLFKQVDVIVAPTNGEQLVATNLTGHPAVILPNGVRGDDAPVGPKVDIGDDDSIGGPGTPVSLTFLGGLYQDAKLCAFARAYQEATGFQKQHPKLA